MNQKLINEIARRLKSEFNDIDNDYLSEYSNEVRYDLSANGKMKKAKRKSFAWVVKNTLGEIKENIKVYTKGNPTIFFDDIGISLNGELIDKCFKKYCNYSFNS